MARGWTVRQFQRWLGDCLVAVLLDPEHQR
jgi:hypothetical protein